MLLVITSIDLAAFKKVAYTVSDPDKRLVTKQLMDPRGKFKLVVVAQDPTMS